MRKDLVVKMFEPLVLREKNDPNAKVRACLKPLEEQLFELAKQNLALESRRDLMITINHCLTTVFTFGSFVRPSLGIT